MTVFSPRVVLMRANVGQGLLFFLMISLIFSPTEVCSQQKVLATAGLHHGRGKLGASRDEPPLQPKARFPPACRS